MEPRSLLDVKPERLERQRERDWRVLKFEAVGRMVKIKWAHI